MTTVPSTQDREQDTRNKFVIPLSLRGPNWKQVLACLLISITLLIPCVWHPRIEAGDLASHTYNAWLTTLVKQGKAPGLWIAPQHNNVLFDELLLRLCSAFSFVAGEKIATAIVVLVFFWSAFALSSIASGGSTWFLAPLLAMLSYGYTMEMGFLNFYLSLGLSFAGLAILWIANGSRLLWLLLLVPLIWMAHPLGLAWFVSCASFLLIAKRLEARQRWILVFATIGLLVCSYFVLRVHYSAVWTFPWYRLNGTDQVFLGWQYRFVPYALLGATGLCVLLDLLVPSQKSEGLKRSWLAMQLWMVVLLGVMLLPDGLMFPSYPVPVLFINTRFTVAAAILGCCALGMLKPFSRIAFGCLTTGIALVFFWLLFFDTGHVYLMEREAEGLIQHVSRDGRVISTLFPMQGSRVLSHHIADRACIERCFVLDNYEASTGQFRLRADVNNRIVAANPVSADEMMTGRYVVKPEDLPVWHIFQCGPSEIDLCLRPLKPGPLNGVLPQK